VSPDRHLENAVSVLLPHSVAWLENVSIAKLIIIFEKIKS